MVFRIFKTHQLTFSTGWDDYRHQPTMPNTNIMLRVGLPLQCSHQR